MTEIIFLIVIATLIVLLVLNSFVRNYSNMNSVEMKRLQTTLEEIKKRIQNIEAKDQSAYMSKPNEVSKQPVVDSLKTEDRALEPVVTPVKEVVSEVIPTPVVPKSEPIAAAIPTPRPVTPAPKPTPAPQPGKTFFEKYPDLEKFIGENLINKIGIVILVLGIAFFVKFAIDKNWINEIGRVAIGVLSAGALLGLAHKLRKGYKAFSSVLVGGGLAVLYFTIALAYHTPGYPLYQQQTASFIILVFVTMFAVFLSVLYNRMEIAILAILGGFSAPLMVSNGSGNYIVLFSYLMLLDAGMLVLSYYKKWRAVNIVAFAFTMVLFGGWLIAQLVDSKYDSFGGAFFFATGFYVIFFLMNIIYNFKNNIRFKVGDIFLILSNTFIYFSFAMIMLSNISDGAFKGLFSVLLGVFNFVFAYITHKRQNSDVNLLFLLIGLVFTFVTLAVPLQLEGNYITLFWAAEGVLLFWLSQKSGFKILQLSSVVVTFLMLISLIMDWNANYQIAGFAEPSYVKQLGFLFNKMVLTTLVSGGALIGCLLLAKKETGNIAWIFSASVYRWLILVAGIIVFYAGGLTEVNYQAYHFFNKTESMLVAMFTFNSLFILMLLAFATKIDKKAFSIVVSAIAAFFLILFLGSLSSAYATSIIQYINGSEALSGILLLFRWISVFAVYVIGVLLFKLVNKANNNQQNGLAMLNIGVLVFTILYMLSADLDTIGILITKSQSALLQTQRTGYAILWGLSSFLLMVIGMRKKVKILRILSLVLFAITIFKLFIFDIRDISEAGKIIAFILLGVLLLIISFMYQKVKKLIVDDDFLKTPQDSEESVTKE